jgi:hypothetical protein
MRKAAFLTVFAGTLAAGTVANATLTPTNTAQLAAWSSGSLVFQTGNAPTTDSGGTSQDNAGWGQQPSGTGGFGSLAETFTVSSSGTVQNFQVVMAGAPQTFNVELYDLGPVSSFNAGTAGVYPAVPGQSNFVATTNSPNTAGVDLLSNSFGPPATFDQFVFNGLGTGVQSLFTLTPSETVNLSTGELYALALDPTASAANTWWVRGGTPSASFSTGEGWQTDSATYAFAYQNFEGKAGPYSSGGRNFDMAVTLAPEPASLGMIGLGAMSFLARRRRA